MDFKKIEEKLPYIIMGLAALIAIFSIFTAVRTIEDANVGSDAEAIMSGLRSVFGGNVDAIGQKAGFSFTLLIGYFLPLGLAGAFGFFYIKKPEKESWNILISTVLMFSFILSLIFIGGLIKNVSGDAGDSLVLADAMFDVVRLGFGAIMAIIFSIFGLMANGYYLFNLVKGKL
jgi:hypothetical protein